MWGSDMIKRSLVILALLTSTSPTSAHDWYEFSCCGNRDCKPVPDDTVTETKDGVLIKGFGLVSETDPRLRWSQDDRDHICSQDISSFGAKVTTKLLCVYRKRKFM